jgi:ATP adenylyltransferase
VTVRIPPGALRAALAERSRQALACGAVQPVETTAETVQDGGVRFVVRALSSLARKAEARWRAERQAAAAPPPDPFLPPEPELLVAEVSDTHLAVLNKFNVIERHLLLVTRAFAHQEALLDAADLEALAACLREIDGLAFYNGGSVAGASQAHKHLQLVPLPLGPGDPVPLEALLGNVLEEGGIRRVPALPFPHALTRVEPHLLGAPERLRERYAELLGAAGIAAVRVDGETRQSAPYNLLATRRWMLAVPRAHECFEGISVNALGFAGSLFVRDETQLAAVKRAGPMALLRHVAGGRQE